MQERGGGSDHKYGRGKFEAHPNYVAYMHWLVEQPAYKGMPNPYGDKGQVQWQVSSGRSTGFSADYDARMAWWEKKAEELGIERRAAWRSLVARMIHPTGYKPCRLCGEYLNVGYLYLSAAGVRATARAFSATENYLGQSVIELLVASDGNPAPDATRLRDLFPEREQAFDTHGVSQTAFEETTHVRSRLLSPGFMSNAPDRLDGFHDYCVQCRSRNDPGRSRENLRTYQHDRRAFEWWAEGDWGLADAVYNGAGPGFCHECERPVKKVSPDHVGPLACGFKQAPVFVATCQPCNASRNRRLSASDVERLVHVENLTGESVASRQVRAVWDATKHNIANDAQALALSNAMRTLQDSFLRSLDSIRRGGATGVVVGFLHPEFALAEHTINGFDPATLQFTSVTTESRPTPGRWSLACRSVRIALQALPQYAGKAVSERRLAESRDLDPEALATQVLAEWRRSPAVEADADWAAVNAVLDEPEDAETLIRELLTEEGTVAQRVAHAPLLALVESTFDRAGRRRAPYVLRH